ncbi:DUF397 domain-containing protein [Streptomyces sp. NPDC015220]|uniref:DUF397 domain-containing protein n=1 Tax=Streptomyces sp. NPDC015220 TaxID=3364947 RepID=UPI0036F659D9
MTGRNPAPLTWFKSSYSAGDGGQCVEVAVSPHGLHIRDSKNTERADLTVRRHAWASFIGFVAERAE